MGVKYNGWENWHTWNTALWLNNEEYSYREGRRICNGRMTQTQAYRALKCLAREIIPKNEKINFDMVNWEEIYNNFNEE